MHYISCIIFHIFFHFCSYPGVLLCFSTLFSKLSHRYNTWANSRKEMENLEQENRELREEVTALKPDMANLTTLMKSLMASQNHPPCAPPFAQP